MNAFILVAVVILTVITYVPALYDPHYWWDGTCGISKYPDAGLPRTSSYIVDGSDARPNEFPWIACTRIPQDIPWHNCGGVIIHPYWVLTAAHCTVSQQVDEFEVVVGEHDRNDTYNPARRVHAVEKIIIHPLYKAQTEDYDISMIKVRTPIEFNENVTAACAPTFADVSNYFDMECQVSGWGTYQYRGPCCEEMLQWTYLYVINTSVCESMYVKPITDNMLCAGDNANYTEKDTCYGDSGGPLTVINNELFEVIGLTSWGYGCASGKPGLYVNLPYFRDWVKMIMDNY